MKLYIAHSFQGAIPPETTSTVLILLHRIIDCFSFDLQRATHRDPRAVQASDARRFRQAACPEAVDENARQL
jgi:hypothetical protein